MYEICQRYFLAALIAVGVTAGLIFIMQRIVSVTDVEIVDRPLINILEAWPVIEEPPIQPTPPPFEKPQPPLEPPLATPQFALADGIGAGLSPAAPRVAPVTMRAGGYADGDALPIMTVPPEYPERMLNRGVEGWVVVEFGVDELGRVVNPRVIEAKPAHGFNQAALRAVLRYKYKPRVVDGQPIGVAGMRQRIVFSVGV